MNIDRLVPRLVAALVVFSYSMLTPAATNMWFQGDTLLPLTPQANANFGFSVAARHGAIAVGEPIATVNGLVAAGRVTASRRAGGLFAPIISENPGSGDFFGWSVAIDGDNLHVGAPFEDANGAGSGSISHFVYIAAQQRWDWSGTSFGSSGNLEALSIARDGDLLAYGLPGSVSPSGGLVAISYAGQSFNFLAELNGAVNGDYLGASIAVYRDPDVAKPDLAVVGAPHRNDNAGGVYVWKNTTHTSNHWEFVTYLTAPSAMPDDQFGASVAVGPQRIVVGAPGRHQNGAASAGAAYVFVPDSDGVWQQESQLVLANPAAGDAFGTAVAYDPLRDRVFSSAPYRFHTVFGGTGETGGVFVFKRTLIFFPSTFTWFTTAELRSLDQPSIGQGEGRSIAVDGDRIYVGAPGYTNGSLANSGRVLTFVADDIFEDNFD
jgi:hypothetical protein